MLTASLQLRYIGKSSHSRTHRAQARFSDRLSAIHLKLLRCKIRRLWWQLQQINKICISLLDDLFEGRWKHLTNDSPVDPHLPRGFSFFDSNKSINFLFLPILSDSNDVEELLNEHLIVSIENFLYDLWR